MEQNKLETNFLLLQYRILINYDDTNENKKLSDEWQFFTKQIRTQTFIRKHSSI